jgi:8-oxo-dGTP pyrophosphatase MutT (NUDIX family)
VKLLPYAEYARSLNRKRTAAGVLFRDAAGRVLLVETSYKPEWEIPGGAVEADEAPWTTAVREIREELGLERPLGQLLVVDHVSAQGVMPEGLAFIWDGGVLSDADLNEITLKDPEIVSLDFCGINEVIGRVKPVLAGRLAAALRALEHNGVVYCENGQSIT